VTLDDERRRLEADYDRSRTMIPGRGTPGFVEPPGAPLWRQAEAIQRRVRQGEATDEELAEMEALYEESLRLSDAFYTAMTARAHQPGSDEPVLGSQRLAAEPFQS
jgi:hypothetical protein